MSTHYITPAANVTACGHQVYSQAVEGDFVSTEWVKATCKGCLAARPAEQASMPVPVPGHDRRKSPAAWTHDCETCVYLDTVEGERVHDLYYHPRTFGSGGPSVIARYGNDGGDYSSGLGFASRDPLLALALVLALKRGLIKFEDARRRL